MKKLRNSAFATGLIITALLFVFSGCKRTLREDAVNNVINTPATCFNGQLDPGEDLPDCGGPCPCTTPSPSCTVGNNSMSVQVGVNSPTVTAITGITCDTTSGYLNMYGTSGSRSIQVQLPFPVWYTSIHQVDNFPGPSYYDAYVSITNLPNGAPSTTTLGSVYINRDNGQWNITICGFQVYDVFSNLVTVNLHMKY